MPTKRYEKLSSDTRRRILDAARAEFVANGYDEASVNRIALAAEIHKGSLYYYFEDKADLFLTVVREASTEMLESMGLGDLDRVLAEPPKDFWEFLSRTTAQKVAFALHHPDVVKLMTEAYVGARSGRLPAFQELLQQSIATLRALIMMGQAAGEVRADLAADLIVDVLYALTDVMNRPLLEDPALLDRYAPTELQRYSALQIDMFKRLLQVPKGRIRQ
ncbi:MAG: TetR/AcrR family transcriptional regulator [Cyanobacteria bacterium REEB65]|nr:TetR/AcrR family transcriptional regulator [Cyanobacteria bacterium REEB65]